VRASTKYRAGIKKKRNQSLAKHACKQKVVIRRIQSGGYLSILDAKVFIIHGSELLFTDGSTTGFDILARDEEMGTSGEEGQLYTVNVAKAGPRSTTSTNLDQQFLGTEIFALELYLSKKTPNEHLEDLRVQGWTCMPLLTPADASALKAQVSSREDVEFGADDNNWWQKRSLAIKVAASSGACERFVQKELSNGAVTFRTQHGTYLSCGPGGVIQQSPCQGARELFHLMSSSEGTAIKTCDGKWVSTKNSTVKQRQTQDPELFTVQQFSSDGTVSLRSQQGVFLSAPVPERKLQQRIGDIALHSVDALKVASHPLLLDLLQQYMGDVKMNNFSSNTLLKQKKSGVETGAIWHVDYPYKNDGEWEPGSQPPLGVQVLVCLDEFTATNGGTMFYTNTHVLGTPPMEPKGPWNKEEKYSTPPPSKLPNGVTAQCEQLGRRPTTREIEECACLGFVDDPNVKRYHPCPAGSAIISHSAWWHRQVRNYSDSGPGGGLASHHPNRRTALLGNYTRSNILPMKGEASMAAQHLAIEARHGHLDSRRRETVKQLWLGR
jgi:hypothetical protein